MRCKKVGKDRTLVDQQGTVDSRLLTNGTIRVAFLLGLWIMVPVAQATNNCCMYRDGVRVCADGHSQASCEALENGKFFPDRTCDPLFGLCGPKSGSAIGEPCSECGPDPDWVDSCNAGVDAIDSHAAVVGIDTTGDCEADMSFVLQQCPNPDNLLVIARSDSSGGVIDTEIVDLCLTGGGVTLRAGAGNNQGSVPLDASVGQISKLDSVLAESYFDVLFEVQMGTDFLHNQTPLQIESEIDCVPPVARYVHPTGCLPLFNEDGIETARLVSAVHITLPTGSCCLPDDTCANLDRNSCLELDGRFHSVLCDKLAEKGGCDPPIPATSEWGLAVLALVVLIAGTVVLRRRQVATA